MTAGVVNRMIVAASVSAVALFGLTVATSAQAPQSQQQQKAQKKTDQQQAKQQEQDRRQQQAGQQRQVQQQRESRQNQQQVVDRQQQRLAQYRDHLDRQQQLAQKQSARLQQQKRPAQYGYQQQYIAGLSQQQLRIRSQGGYDYGHDYYLYTAPSYRYSRGGQSYETNQNGVDLLRRSVNTGYEQGRLAGMADQQDRWPFNYSASYAYQDANYGYGGFFVDRDDYNVYFREGFRRGYEDGYYGRYQYGAYDNGRTSILATVLAAIVTFEAIRR